MEIITRYSMTDAHYAQVVFSDGSRRELKICAATEPTDAEFLALAEQVWIADEQARAAEQARLAEEAATVQRLADYQRVGRVMRQQFDALGPVKRAQVLVNLPGVGELTAIANGAIQMPEQE